MVLVVALGVAATACGGGSGDISSSGSKQSTTSDTSAKSYVGLTEKEAVAKAKSEGRQWRVLRRDDESFPATQDFVESRINFEIDNGKVTKATYG
jgi:DNA polymerase II large subunit